MDLGTLISELRTDASAARALAALGDIVLFAEVAAMGELFEEAPGEYVAGAAGRFASAASHEDWLNLIGTMERADDKGEAALAYILRWALNRDAEALHAAPEAGFPETMSEPDAICSSHPCEGPPHLVPGHDRR